MATLANTAVSLLDLAKRLDPKGKAQYIVELLNQKNQILEDMKWTEGNTIFGNVAGQRTGLPTVYWKITNQGVPVSSSKTVQVAESCGKLEAWSELACDIADIGGNPNAVRMTEAMAFVEAMAQEMAQTLFYGNSGITGSPFAQEEFVGLSPRYSALSGAGNSSHVLSAGGSGADNSSVWLLGWGEGKVHGIVPMGTKAGLTHQNFGEVTQETTAGVGGTRDRVYSERWTWRAGLNLANWQYAVRLCNIDISNLVAQSSAADLPTLMIKMLHRIPDLAACTPAFYMNRTVREMFDIQLRNDVRTGGQLSYENVGGKPVTKFRGVPCRIVDQLLETEAAVA